MSQQRVRRTGKTRAGRVRTLLKEHNEIVAAVITGLLALVGTAITVALNDSPANSLSDGATSAPAVTFSAGRPPMSKPVVANIVNTGGDGVYSYGGPSTEDRFPDGYKENTRVTVVCQERRGELVADVDPVPGQPKEWPVWDKLDNGRWIPDLWTTLPKVPGPVPPLGLPTCPPTVRPTPS